MSINSSTNYPVAFFDTGGGSADLINPNKVEAGTLMGQVQVGSSGVILDPFSNAITVPAANISINGGGFTLGGVSIAGDYYFQTLGPMYIDFTMADLTSANGVTLWMPQVGDIIWHLAAVQLSYAASAGGTAINVYISSNFSQHTITDALYEINLRDIVDSTDPNPVADTGGSTAMAPYFYGTRSHNDQNVATALNTYPMAPICRTNTPICAKLDTTGGIAVRHVGKTAIYALIMRHA